MLSAKCCLFIQSQWCKRNSMLPQKYHSYINSISLATCHIRIATRHRTFSISDSLIIVWIIYRCRYFMGTIAHLHVIWMWSGTLPVYTLFKRQGRLILHTNDMKVNYLEYWWRKQHMPTHTGKGYLIFLNSIYGLNSTTIGKDCVIIEVFFLPHVLRQAVASWYAQQTFPAARPAQGRVDLRPSPGPFLDISYGATRSQ